MEKIASFTIDHIKLEPGVYVSRKDTVGSEVITTFDLRMTSPNDEPVMNTAEAGPLRRPCPGKDRRPLGADLHGPGRRGGAAGRRP